MLGTESLHQMQTPPPSMVEMLRELGKKHGTNLDKLLLNSGDKKLLDETLTQMAIQALQDNPEFIKNKSIVHNKKSPKSEQMAAAQRQRTLVDEMKRLIAQQAGIQNEQWESEIATTQRRVESIIDTAYLENRIHSPEDVLRELGILSKDDSGDDIFTYPEALFPSVVNEKWYVYLLSVTNHLSIENQVRQGMRPKEDLKEADLARRVAHNAISRDVQKILGTEQWTLEEARRLLAKMRDTTFPSINTGEAGRLARDIAGAVGNTALIAALQLLSKR